MQILTLNLRHNNDHWEQRKPLVIDLIQALQPDIIGFQEVWMPIQQAHLILDAVDGQAYTIYATPKQAHHGKEGIAIATRLPSSQPEVLHLPGGERVAQRVMIDVDNHSLCFANTHLHHLPQEDESERLPQMKALLEWLSTVDTPTIITGDMNTIPTRETMQLATKQYHSAYQQVHGHEPDYTFPAPLAAAQYPDHRVTIDYILISPDTLHATSARIVGDETHGTDPILSPSDHCGILATIELTGNG